MNSYFTGSQYWGTSLQIQNSGFTLVDIVAHHQGDLIASCLFLCLYCSAGFLHSCCLAPFSFSQCASGAACKELDRSQTCSTLYCVMEIVQHVSCFIFSLYFVSTLIQTFTLCLLSSPSLVHLLCLINIIRSYHTCVTLLHMT